MFVNSRHENTIDNYTKYYKVVAVDDDGYAEVLEAIDKKFNIAIRFYPESLCAKDEKQNIIFEAFI